MRNALAWRATSNNEVPVRNVYPSQGRSSLGTRAGSQTPESGEGAGAVSDEAAAVVPGAAVLSRGGPLGQPLAWWGVLVALLFALMFVAKRVGSEGDFSNVKLSVYNVLVISLASIIGIAFFKVVFTRFNVPGLSPLVAAV
jgi:hypothetical protein